MLLELSARSSISLLGVITEVIDIPSTMRDIRSMWLSPLHTPYGTCLDAKPAKQEQNCLTTRVWRASNEAPVEPNAGRQG